MTSTIETNNSNVLKKIECLISICIYLKKIICKKAIDEYIIRIKIVHNNYLVESANLLADYYKMRSKYNESKQKEQYTRFYQRYLKSNNISTKLDVIYIELYKIYIDIINKKSYRHMEEITGLIHQKNDKPGKDMPFDFFDDMGRIKSIENTCHLLSDKTMRLIQKEGILLFSEYKKIKIHLYIEEVEPQLICNRCGEPYKTTNIGEQSCIICGICIENVITIIDDENITNEINNNKSGSYDPSKHCREWLDRIQGREIIDMATIDHIVNILKEQFIQERIKHNEIITYELIRIYLQKNKFSSYNEHIPLIRKLITGISPPQLTDVEIQKIIMYFIRIVKIYNKIKPTSKINCPYHPYIIYKILEQILEDGWRKTAILHCIHLQSSQTLILNDRIWQKICVHIPEFKYIPTDRNRR